MPSSCSGRGRPTRTHVFTRPRETRTVGETHAASDHAAGEIRTVAFELRLLPGGLGGIEPRADQAKFPRRRHCKPRSRRRDPGRAPGVRAARQDPDRRASPFHSARARRRDGDTAQRRAAAEVVGADVARGHGQERHRHLDRLAGAAGHLVRRRCPAVAQARPRMQRIRGEDDCGSSRPLRPVRHHLAAGHRRQPQGDRIRARHAQGRRHRPDDELRRQVSRRSCVRAGLSGAQPAQGTGLCAPDHAELLRPGDRGHSAFHHRVCDRQSRAPSVSS